MDYVRLKILAYTSGDSERIPSFSLVLTGLIIGALVLCASAVILLDTISDHNNTRDRDYSIFLSLYLISI